MPRPSNSSRQPIDSYELEDDGEDNSFAQHASKEKLQHLISDLIGRWYWIALGLILGILGGLYFLSKAPSLYEARSTVLVKQRASSVISRDQAADEVDLRSLEGLNTISSRIQRPELLQKVAARPDIRSLPGLIPKPVNWLPEWTSEWLGTGGKPGAEKATKAAPEPAMLAGMMSQWLDVSIRRGTRLLDLTVTHPTPEVAKAIADGVAQEFQRELIEARSGDRSSSLGILTKESEQARTRLQTAQNSLANYDRAISTHKELEAREGVFNDLSRRYLKKHPKMVAASAELASHQARFLSEFDAVRNATADRAYWKENEEELRKVESDPYAKLQIARRLLLARGTVLQSEIVSQNSVFNSILTRIQESGINQQGIESETELSSSASLPGAPSSPKKPKVLAMAGLGGLALGILFAFVLVKLDNKFHTVAQVERDTGLPTLAAISDIPLKILNQVTRGKKADPLKVSEAQGRWDPRLIFREATSSTTFAEMFRILRASVSLLGDEKKRKVTLFSSALPGEGKTFISCNFALAAAQQGKRTLLIDLDLRKPALHRLFGLQRDSHPRGSTEVLAGQCSFEEAIFTDTGDAHLHLMLSGKRAPNPGELLNATTLDLLLEAATSQYDVIVIDSAPLLAVPDTRIIVPLVDNFCLVTRAEYVPKDAVRRVLDLLHADDNSPSGIVFNGFHEKKRLIGQNYSYGNYRTSRYGKAYKYGYGSYGAYGSDSD